MTTLKGLPVCNHQFFGVFWNRYAESFNKLAEKIEAVGIDVTELREVIYAAQDIERLSFVYVEDTRRANG